VLGAAATTDRGFALARCLVRRYLELRGARPVQYNARPLFWVLLEIAMSRYLVGAVAAIALLAGAAQAQTLIASSNVIINAVARSFDFTSDTTTSVRDSKIVLAARDDAASFVASQGAIRGAQLEAALTNIRSRVPEANGASDLVLAEAILAL
jgi:uncharacterized protein (TIGR02448 family)